jgi:hypothetical protein
VCLVLTLVETGFYAKVSTFVNVEKLLGRELRIISQDGSPEWRKSGDCSRSWVTAKSGLNRLRLGLTNREA